LISEIRMEGDADGRRREGRKELISEEGREGRS
jgi:hypothetical protein